MDGSVMDKSMAIWDYMLFKDIYFSIISLESKYFKYIISSIEKFLDKFLKFSSRTHSMSLATSYFTWSILY